MDGKNTSRVIRCTEVNAHEFKAFIRRWPELRTLVLGLQAADLFPGLRGMQVTLVGGPEWVSRGVAAVASENAAVAAGEAHAH